MNKQVIRLSESDLHNVICESVRRIVAENEENEGQWDYVTSLYNQGKEKAKQARQQIGAAIGNAYQGTKEGLQNMHQNALDASARGDMPKIVGQLQRIQQRVKRLMPGNNQASAAIQRVINLLNRASQQAPQ